MPSLLADGKHPSIPTPVFAVYPRLSSSGSIAYILGLNDQAEAVVDVQAAWSGQGQGADAGLAELLGTA